MTRIKRFITNILDEAASIGADPEDSDELRLQKTLFANSMVFGALPSEFLIGVAMLLFQETLVGLVLFAFFFIFLGVLIFFNRTGRYQESVTVTLALILVNAYLFSVLLGTWLSVIGMLWAFLCPLGALVLDNPQTARRWFLAYIGFLALFFLSLPFLRTTNNLPLIGSFVAAVMSIVCVTGIAFYLLNQSVTQKNIFQERSEMLLLNILPVEIAAILKKEERMIADYHAEATILFADIVDFTPMTISMSAEEVVELLNEVFTHFDFLVEKYGLEKIKTIGDCYMVAAGVPQSRLDHAQVLTQMALDIREYIDDRQIQGKELSIRIGLNSGPVIAGVIGRRKFIYDLWGDTVNTASRMESHGANGVIQISESTYELIQDSFSCETRGIINVKGKGEMKVWHVLGKKA